ncbi:MAG: pyridoxal phosphate-dependent aminotransferase [Chloroflexi bacterium]|nr:pyridoxal phosphate-dependent aminotransferase [Chloroflexota bacterium]
MTYDFDTVIDRRGTGSVKWDLVDARFGTDGALPMWVADMDFRSPAPVVEALKKTAEHGFFGYATMLPAYYEAVIAWMKKRHGWSVQRDWICFSPGVVPALNLIVKAFTEPGDQVIVQSPVYHPFFALIERNGRRVLDNPLQLSNGRYQMDLSDLESKLTARARIMLLCSPHNPVGRVWSEQELKDLADLCLRHGLLVIADEIHHDLVYPGHAHTVFPTVREGLERCTIVCTAASKTFNLPGLHTSNVIIPEHRLRERFGEAAMRDKLGSPNPFGTAATEAAYRHGEQWLEEVLCYLSGNLDFVNRAAARVPGLKVIQPEGTYLVWLDLRQTGIPRGRLADFLCTEAKVAVEAGRHFGAKEDGFVRMNIACPRATLAEAWLRIERAVARPASSS